MAKITRDEILKLAKLSRLELSDNEVNRFTKEIEDVLSYVEILDKANVDNLRPTYQVSGNVNATRDDSMIDYGTTKEDLLKNLPNRQGDLIKVKRMIG